MTISIGQAMRNAIEAERAAARFYDRLVGRAGDAEGKKFFQEMADQERDHADAIAEMAGKIGSDELPTRADTRVDMVETVPGWAEVDNITIDQALELALDAENGAALYYDALADFCEPGAKAFFARMVAAEEAHATQIRELISTRS